MSDYNGWSNYETWNVKLWIDNEEGNYNYWRETTRELFEHDCKRDKDATIQSLADMPKEQHEENTPTVTGVYADLLNAALSEVDWYEIAEVMVNDEDFEEEETESA